MPCARLLLFCSSTQVVSARGALHSMPRITAAYLERCFPGCEVWNCFEHTNIETYQSSLNVGLFVVKNVVKDERAAQWASDLNRTFAEEFESGSRGTSVRGAGSGSKKKYASMQATTGICQCFYDYAGTTKHKLKKVEDFEVFANCLNIVNKNLWLVGKSAMSQVVVNEYCNADNENTPWHSDANRLLNEDTIVASVSLGAPGVFCWTPDARGYAHVFNLSKRKQEDLKQEMIRREMRGLVPLMPGDVMFMVGLFQKYFLHKTLMMSEFVTDTIDLFPATNANNRGSWLRHVEFLSHGRRLPTRYCVTTRIIAIHDAGCPEIRVRAERVGKKYRSGASTPASSASGSTGGGGVSGMAVRGRLARGHSDADRDERLRAVSCNATRRDTAVTQAMRALKVPGGSDFEDDCADVGEVDDEEQWTISQQYSHGVGFVKYLADALHNLEEYVDSVEPQQKAQLMCGA